MNLVVQRKGASQHHQVGDVICVKLGDTVYECCEVVGVKVNTQLKPGGGLENTWTYEFMELEKRARRVDPESGLPLAKGSGLAKSVWPPCHSCEGSGTQRSSYGSRGCTFCGGTGFA